MFDEAFDAQKIKSMHGCGECVFCLAKCPKCSAVDVEITYIRQYFEDGDVDSETLIACRCGRTDIKEHTIPSEVTGGEPFKFESYKQAEYYSSTELTKLFDEEFLHCHPIHPTDVTIVYKLDNDTENELSLKFEEIDNEEVEFDKKLPCSIYYEINEKKEIKCITRTVI